MSSIFDAQSIPIDLKKLSNNHSDEIPAEVEYFTCKTSSYSQTSERKLLKPGQVLHEA